jgi:hypothetical protein
VIRRAANPHLSTGNATVTAGLVEVVKNLSKHIPG